MPWTTFFLVWLGAVLVVAGLAAVGASSDLADERLIRPALRYGRALRVRYRHCGRHRLVAS